MDRVLAFCGTTGHVLYFAWIATDPINYVVRLRKQVDVYSHLVLSYMIVF